MATDLAIEGRVSPTELQIVCAALSGEFTKERYRSSGAARGLLSYFVHDVISVAGNPNLTKSVLRTLCGYHSKTHLREALSPGYIAKMADADTTGTRAKGEEVISVLKTLEQVRVVMSINNRSGLVWSLTHDYLVEPIRRIIE